MANVRTRYLVEVFLPLADNTGRALPRRLHHAVYRELVARFGGVTAHARAPARGAWKAPSGTVAFDDLVVLEVMTPRFAARWWSAFRRRLEVAFAQEEIVVRVQRVRLV